LAEIVRAYLRRRYHLAAGELTSVEVVPSGRRRGFRSAELAGFASLLRAADESRYRPDRVAAGICRNQTAAAVALIRRHRCRDPITPVDAALRVSAEQAWARLDERYPPSSPETAAAASGAKPSGGRT
jgi:hypothetical protein